MAKEHFDTRAVIMVRHEWWQEVKAAAFQEGVSLAEYVRSAVREKISHALVIAAYQAGYGRGHDDAVEGIYDRSVEEDIDAALEWLREYEN